MSTPTVIETRRNGKPVTNAGERVELARYSTPAAGERILQGLRVNGRAILIDVPDDPDGDGRVYLVERDVHLDGNHALQALIADYLTVAEQLQQVPMATSQLERYLENLP